MRNFTIEELEIMDSNAARELVQTMNIAELRDLESQYNANLGELSEDDIHVWGIVCDKLRSLLVAEEDEKFFKSAPNTPEYDADEVYAEVERLASAITSWDTQNIHDLKAAFDELEEYGQSDEYYHTVGDEDIIRYADIDMSSLPSAKNVDLSDVDTSEIWACDVNGMCLIGSGDYKIVSLAEALRTNNGYHYEISEYGDNARLNTEQAAIELAILRGRNIPYSVNQINAYINNGYLPAKKSGRDWMIKLIDLEKIKDRRRGRELK